MRHRATEIGEARDELRALLDPMLAGEAIRGASDDRLLDLAADAEALGRLLDALRGEIAGEIGHRSRPDRGDESLARLRGCRSASELLERVALVSGATARRRLKASESLRGRASLSGETRPATFEHVGVAFRAGEIGVDTAAAIVDALMPVRDRGVATGADVDAAERALVAAAVGADDSLAASADEIAVMARVWALHLDPDGALPDRDRVERRRSLAVGRERDGVVPLRGDLLPEVAAQLQRMLDAYLNPRVTAGPTFVPDDADVDGDDPLIDPRTQAQRRHDALSGILQVAAGAKDMPLLGGAAPTLIVTTTDAQLAHEDGVAFISGAHDTGAVPIFVARHIGCAGAVQRLVTSPDGRIVELGSPQRIFPPHTRRAIGVRDGECVIPGCGVPAPWCEVHHVTPAARGGPTHTDNGVLLCWHHHRTLDTAGWQIRMVHGVPWVKAPRWLDPAQRWHTTAGSPQRRLSSLSRAATGP